MKSILKRIICFSVLGMLRSYDAKAISNEEMLKLREATCIGVITAIISTNEGGEAGMSFLKDKSTIWLIKYKDYTFEKVKPFIFSGIDLIKDLCEDGNKVQECKDTIRECDFVIKGL